MVSLHLRELRSVALCVNTQAHYGLAVRKVFKAFNDAPSHTKLQIKVPSIF